MNAPIFKILDPKTKLQIDIRNLIHEQLKTSETQSKTSNKQYKISIVLTIAAIIISLAPLITELLIDKSHQNESIIRLTNSQSELTEKVSDMSTYLLALQNQIQTLENENARLKEKVKK